MAELMSFGDALALQPNERRRHLLLGNGFSIACRPDIFTYGALFDRADFAELGESARQSFDVLQTRDFELVMRALQQASEILGLYAPAEAALATRLREDAAALVEVLVRAIADSHPAHPFEIEEDEYLSARRFLSSFKNLYSLSYDLLLYWTAMQEFDEPFSFDDGFRTPDDGPEDYVTWDVEKTDGQNAFYLHGALHVFDGGHQIQKFTWSNTGIRLIDQVREALKSDLFPLIVSEGASEDKLSRINHSNYLARGYRSFAKIGGTLYTFGVAFSENDAHILHLIEKNRRLSILCVGVYGDPDSPANRSMIERIEAMAARRPQRNPLVLGFYDAESAHVWDS